MTRKDRDAADLLEYRAAIAHQDDDTRRAALIRMAARLGRTEYLRLVRLAAKKHDPEDACP